MTQRWQHTCITRFCSFPCRFYTTTTWKCLISRFMEKLNKQRRNWNSTSRGFGYIWQSKCVEIIEIKTERTQIQCLSDVLVAVASLDLKQLKVTFICSSWKYRINTSRNRGILFTHRRIEFKASYAIEFDSYATYKMNYKTQMPLLEKTIFHKYWLFCLRFFFIFPSLFSW